ncbi:aldehyde dehydrogenase family protein [Bacillus sp. E(2018)]|uniref:aldehyde dehydrogenase family protein n=1 Tax=Bacillus sp. E(2018) TaxID=2502239 RepID=UPI0010F8BDBB|nr:aldehyde dehydrogenase family protein [Bacillus sp. E(2018)]
MGYVSVLDRRTSLMEVRKETLDRTIEYMENNRKAIEDILLEISTYRTVEEEFETAIRTLKKGYMEVEMNQPPTINKMSVFMPSNLILYSYVLYLLIPSYYTKEIEFRSSNQVIDQVRRLHDLLKQAHELPITLLELSHRQYMKRSALEAEVVVFTGTYQNAEQIKSQFRNEQMFIYFGQGVNPFILLETADIEKAVHDLIQARMFNTGQDCMGPDVVYVPVNVRKEFTDYLVNSLKNLKFGDNQDPFADYGKMFYTSTLESIGEYLNQHSQFIEHGGTIDFWNKVIEPTVITSSLKDNLEIEEFFSPIFNVVTYEEVDELKKIVQESYFRERAMGASVYGTDDNGLVDVLRRKHVVSINETLFAIENGNEPFGGYGPMANYVYYKNQLHIKPLLISNVLRELWSSEEPLDD